VTTMQAETVTIQGQRVALPVRVRDASVGSATFTGDVDAIGRGLPAGLVPYVWRPGRGIVVLAFVRYFDNDLGSYDEVAVCYAARPAGPGVSALAAGLRDPRGREAGAYIAHLPVSEEFTCAAGIGIWGYPKSLDDLDLRFRDRVAGGRWARDGREILRLTVPWGGRRPVPETSLSTFSVLDGRLHETAFTTRGEGLRAGVGGARLELGDHPIADELRELRLSRHALMSSSVRRVEGSFSAPRPR
jgi:hypothetical protein